MINAEMVYQKARRLDAFHLQEAADFIDFLLSKTKQAESVKKMPADKSGIKTLLLAMPAVGTDEDFARRRDFGRSEALWDI